MTTTMVLTDRTPADFDTALEAFVAGLTERVAAYYKEQYKSLKPPTHTLMRGQRFIRIVTNQSEGTSRSVWGFVEKDTGNIFMAAGWKAPAKHVRGNIFNANPFEGCAVHGPKYIKGPNFANLA